MTLQLLSLITMPVISDISPEPMYSYPVQEAEGGTFND